MIVRLANVHENASGDSPPLPRRGVIFITVAHSRQGGNLLRKPSETR